MNINTQQAKEAVLKHKALAAVALVLFIGTGSAAITTIVSPTAEAEVQVDKGIDLQVTDAPATIQDNKFETSINAGSTFSYEGYVENLANDKAENLVEFITINSASEDINIGDLEEVTFDAEQVSTTSEGSTVPQGTTMSFSVTPQNTLDQNFMSINVADVNGDSLQEAVVCVANPDKKGLTLGPTEQWNATVGIDTAVSLSSNVEIDNFVQTVYKADGSGDMTPLVKQCEQYTA